MLVLCVGHCVIAPKLTPGFIVAMVVYAHALVVVLALVFWRASWDFEPFLKTI